LLWQILEKEDFKKQVNRLKPETKTEPDLIRRIHLQLLETTSYTTYISNDKRDKKEERKIMEFILNELLLSNPSFISHIGELFGNFEDDGESVVQLIGSLLQKPNSLSLDTLVDPEKEKFARDLLKTAVEKDKHLESLIVPKLKNWDPDRIAVLDMIMMKMGVAEFLYFETIPPKVTINEYIDLAKEYSTAQSGHFVNGILDNVRKELEEQGKLNKIDFKKSKKVNTNLFMNRISIFLALSLLIYTGCKDLPANTNTESTTDATVAGMNTEKIPQEDTSLFTRLTWLDTTDQTLGKLKPGKEIEIKWRFKNTGERPLIIEGVTASCGCTIPEKPEKPLLPGEEGTIKAKFNGSGNGYIVKQVHVVANTNPSKNHTLSFSGEIPEQKQ